jgi:hypothetical protein
MTADERLHALAAILATGLLRLRARAALPAAPGLESGPENFSADGPDPLEVPGETVLSDHTG